MTNIYLSYKKFSNSVDICAKYLINELKSNFEGVEIYSDPESMSECDLMIAIVRDTDLKVAYEIGKFTSLIDNKYKKCLIALIDNKEYKNELHSYIEDYGVCFFDITSIIKFLKEMI